MKYLETRAIGARAGQRLYYPCGGRMAAGMKAHRLAATEAAAAGVPYQVWNHHNRHPCGWEPLAPGLLTLIGEGLPAYWCHSTWAWHPLELEAVGGQDEARQDDLAPALVD